MKLDRLTQIAPFNNLCKADITRGPRQTTAFESSTRSPIERHFMPKLTGGMIILFLSTSGVSFKFIIRGTLGPKISPSRIPTLKKKTKLVQSPGNFD